MTMAGEALTYVSGNLVPQHAFRRPGFARGEIGGKAVQGRAIGADDFGVVAEIEEDMRMIERRVRADAHELTRPNFDDGHSGIILKVRNNVIGHDSHLEQSRTFASKGKRTSRRTKRAHHTVDGEGLLDRPERFEKLKCRPSTEFDTILISRDSPSFVGEVAS